MARTSNSGEFSASIIAIASSVPGSVSKMIFFGAAVAAIETPSSNATASRIWTRNFRWFRSLISGRNWQLSLALDEKSVKREFADRDISLLGMSYSAESALQCKPWHVSNQGV